MKMDQFTEKDVFNKWTALPEWEQRYMRFYATAPESAYKALKIVFLTAAMLSWPCRGWKRYNGKEN
jgi:hypothetical protein